MSFDETTQSEYRIHPLFAAYVGQIPRNQLIWNNGELALNAQEVLSELEQESLVGVQYAREMLHQFYEVVRGPENIYTPPADRLDVAVTAREMFAPVFEGIPSGATVWSTMSGETTAEQMAAMIRADHEHAVEFVQGRLYLARDILASRTRV